MFLDTNTIVVKDRQRKKSGDIDTLANSISRVGQIHPIVVRKDPDGTIILVAGYTRLEACKKLKIQVSATWHEDLSPEAAEEIELEENAKRTDLEWRDYVNAVGTLRDKRGWSVNETSEHLSIAKPTVRDIYSVYKNLDSPMLKTATNLSQAIGILRNVSNRKVASIINEIMEANNKLITPIPNIPTPNTSVPNTQIPNTPIPNTQIPNTPVSNSPSPILATTTPDPVSCADFIKMAADYSGPKFELIHCDFPYDVDYSKYGHSVTSNTEDYKHTGFVELLDALCNNIDLWASYQSHIVVWFSMEFYQSTVNRLEEAGLFVHKHPLIWLKSDNAGIIPGGPNKKYPRRIYETALLCSRGNRPLVRQLSNAYACPSVSNPIHPSQKSEPMLKHFMSMLVDETTRVFDPTCGSGSALCAAEAVGAKSVLGFDIDLNYVKNANTKIRNARLLQRIQS
jgi:ParB/RepB/Spo0J family partition protein